MPPAKNPKHGADRPHRLSGGAHRKSVAVSHASEKRDTLGSTVDIGQRERHGTRHHAAAYMFQPERDHVSDAELKEEIERILTTRNPHAKVSRVVFNFHEMTYKPVPQQLRKPIVVFELEGHMLHHESDEAQKQLRGEKSHEEAAKEEVKEEVSVAKVDEGAGGDEAEEEEDEGTAEVAEQAEPEEAEAGETTGAAGEGSAHKGVKVLNKFNFCDRAGQTYLVVRREHETQTEPPPQGDLSGLVLQWVIFDAYQEDFAIQEAEKERAAAAEKAAAREASGGGGGAPAAGGRPGTAAGGSKDDRRAKKGMASYDMAVGVEDLSGVAYPTKILERLVCQNIYNEINQDFKFWEDLSDEFRDGKGSVLPLWRFGYDRSRGCNNVTCISWSHHYPDLFGVGYGCYEFDMQHVSGTLCLFTLKNPSYPELVRPMPSGVAALDMSPDLPCLLVVGLYNGNVVVVDGRSAETPIMRSSHCKGKHSETVTQVVWGKAGVADGERNFYSLSNDGEMRHWVLGSDELRWMRILRLRHDRKPVVGPRGVPIQAYAVGTSLTLHPVDPALFLVGTEEGKIRLYSTAYTSRVIRSYRGHRLAITGLEWNTFCPDIFISSSEDRTIKIWKRWSSVPVFNFPMSAAVGDVAWSPYASTVFAVPVGDGLIFIFDLTVNRQRPICRQVVASKRRGGRLTHLCFNKTYPIVLLSDERGHIHCLKLSPNLRKVNKDSKGNNIVGSALIEMEKTKMDKILSLIQDPQLD